MSRSYFMRVKLLLCWHLYSWPQIEQVLQAAKKVIPCALLLRPHIGGAPARLTCVMRHMQACMCTHCMRQGLRSGVAKSLLKVPVSVCWAEDVHTTTQMWRRGKCPNSPQSLHARQWAPARLRPSQTPATPELPFMAQPVAAAFTSRPPPVPAHPAPRNRRILSNDRNGWLLPAVQRDARCT